MAGIRLTPEDSDVASQGRAPTAADLISDDERSVAAAEAADSWSIKSDYGSALDDDQRHADASEALAAAATTFPTPSNYSSDKEEPDADAVRLCWVPKVIGIQCLQMNLQISGSMAMTVKSGVEMGGGLVEAISRFMFGPDVMETVASWTKGLCTGVCRGSFTDHVGQEKYGHSVQSDKNLSSWSVLDLGTGNGLLLQELARQGFSDLTGTDYSEGAIDLARSLAERDSFANIKFLIQSLPQSVFSHGIEAVHYQLKPFERHGGTVEVDDVLETKLKGCYKLVMDKGALDAIGLHPDGLIKRIMYWDSASRLVASGGILVITSCNNTKDKLVQEVENFNRRSVSAALEDCTMGDQEPVRDGP